MSRRRVRPRRTKQPASFSVSRADAIIRTMRSLAEAVLIVAVGIMLSACSLFPGARAPYAALKEKCDSGSQAACHDYAFHTYDSDPGRAQAIYTGLCDA